MTMLEHQTAAAGSAPGSGEAGGHDIDPTHVSQREHVVTAAVTALAVAVGIGLGAILIAVAGGSPLQAYLDLLDGAIGGRRELQRLANEAAPLAIMALGYAVAFRARFFAIGAQGHHDVGGLAAGALVLNVGLASPWIGMPAAMVVGAVAAALLGAITAVLRTRWGVNEVIASLMLTYAAYYLLAWAVRKPLRNPKGFIPQSANIPSWARMPHLPGTDLYVTVLLAVVLVPLLAWMLGHTPFGVRVSIIGHNADAARTNGIAVGRTTLIAAVTAAVLAGLSGVFRLLGPEGRLSQPFSTSMGFTAIVVALLGRNRPLGVLLAAVFLTGLDIGGATMQRTQDVPAAVSVVIQAVLVLLVLASNRILDRRRTRRALG